MAPLLPRVDGVEGTDTRSQYAQRKVKGAVKEHEHDIQVTPPIKVVLLGNSGVGKTCLMRGDDPLSPHPPPATVGASFVTHDVHLKEEHGMDPSSSLTLRLQVWDTAGQERFRCMVPMYMRNAAAAIIVFDLTNRQSFEDVDKWEQELHRSCSTSDPAIILVGNKADLVKRRVVAGGEALLKASHMQATYVETSATDNKFVVLLEDVALRARVSVCPQLETVPLVSSSPSSLSSSSCCPLL